MNWRLANRPFGSYVFLWIGLGILTLTLLLVGRASSARKSEGWVIHTLEVLGGLDSFESSILQADLLSRPVPLSNETKRQVLADLKEASDALNRLTDLTRDNPRQTARINELRQLMDQAAGVIRIRMHAVVIAFTSPLLTGDPAAILPMIESVRGMRREERRLLMLRRQEQADNDDAFWRTTLFALMLNIGLIWWSYLASRSYIRERNEHEAKIETLNRQLGDQVTVIRILNSSLEERIREKTSELEGTVSKLRSTNAELERFAYVASHDLQEPLRQVASFNNLLSIKYGDRLDEVAQRYLANSIAGAKRLQLMIGRLLQYTVISSTALRPVPVSAAVLTKRVLRSLDEQIRTTGAVVEISGADELTFTADEEMLYTVFESLISNAIRFRRKEAPPTIHVAFQCDAEGCTASFKDNGIGVDSRFTTRMFEMFSRYHAVGEYEGVGAGLAIARKIMEKHGGTLDVASNAPDPGSSFTLRIPIVAANAGVIETGTDSY